MSEVNSELEKFATRDFDGTLISYVNPRLVEKQGLADDQVEIIKALHRKRHHIFTKMKDNLDNHKLLRKLADEVTEIEFVLQETWKFGKDIRFHRFWDLPGCTCPKMDNDERVGTNYTIITCNCPIHGGDNGKEKGDQHPETEADTAS